MSYEAPLLIVEDSEEDYETVVEALALAKIPNPVRRATSGDDCLRLLRGEGDEAALRPVLVLLDLNMPGLDGRDALAEIRRDRSIGLCPVVILSTSANPRDIEQCYRSGANAFHVKPLRYADHLRLLEQLLAYWIASVVWPARLGART